MAKLKVKQVRCFDLFNVVASIKPSDLPDVKTMRKISGAVDALEAPAKVFFNKSNELQEKVNAIVAPFKPKLVAVEGKEDPESKAEHAKLLAQVNKKLEVLNPEKLELDEVGLTEVEVEIDDNYLAALKEEFKKSKDKFTSLKPFLELCDVLGIEE